MAAKNAIFAMSVGMGKNWMRSGIMPVIRNDAGRDTPVPYIIWCIDTAEGPLVVDTGFHPDILGAAWCEGKDFIEPPTLLGEIGVKADEIRTVLVTHLHLDHFTGYDFFPNATFVMQRSEYEFWTGPMMRYELFQGETAPGAPELLARLNGQGRIQLLDGDAEFQPGIQLLHVGGHTPGSQMVGVDTPLGTAVICGDIAYTYRNLHERLPVGWYHDLGGCVKAIDRALATATQPDLAYPHHDPQILQGKRLVRVI